MITYQIKGYLAFSDKDTYANGCEGPSKSEHNAGYTAMATSLDVLIDGLCADFNAEPKDVTLNCCGEPGRLDIQVQQREPFHCAKVSPATYAKFKEGKINLWLTNYIFQVQKVETDFDLAACVEDASIYNVEAV